MKDNVLIKVKNFELSQADSHNLYLEINKNGYHYAVVDPSSNDLKLIGSSSNSIYEESNEILNGNFEKINICMLSKNFTFLPEVHYISSLKDSYANFLQVDYQDIIESNFLKYQEIRNIYAFNKVLLNDLKERFAKAQFFPQVNSFFNAALYNSINSHQTQVFFNVKEEYTELLVLAKQDLLFYNIFEIKNDDELQYFLMLTLQHINLKASELSINISGNIVEDSETHNRIKGLFNNVEVSKPGFVKISKEFQELHFHQYFSLLGLHLCA